MISIKRNFLYSSILTTANYLFPFLTFPYVSRVLGVNNIGICNFVDSIVNYFILFSMMGIGVLGIREVAKCKNDNNKLNKVFNELFVLNSFSTLLALVVLLFLIFFTPYLSGYKELMFIGVFKLIFNYLLIEWLYKGLEDFKYITIRTILIKVLYVIFVFAFVRTSDDIFLYYLLSSMMIVVNAIVNCIYAKRFVKIQFEKIELKYIKPFFALGLYALLTSMYTSFNIAYLGFICGDVEVGYYTTAIKLFTILLALYTAFTGVMLPRMSSLISQNNYSEFRIMIDKSVDILFAFSVPLILFSVIMAPGIVQVISGSGYEGAIIPMQLVVPLMLIIGYEQILVIQILMPLKKDRAILTNSILGAVLGLLMNLLIVPYLKGIGSSIVWLCSEIIVLFSAQYFVSKYIHFSFPTMKLLKNVAFHTPLALGIYCVRLTQIDIYIQMIIAVLLLGLYVLFLQIYILKNEIILSVLNRMR